MNNFILKIIPEKYKKELKLSLGVPDMFWSLQNLKKAGFNPSTIIDIGAYQGEWTKEVFSIFPKANFLMLEAMPEKLKWLQQIKEINPEQIDFKIQLMGASDSETVVFHELETASSVLSEHFETNAKCVERKLATLDNTLINTKWQQPSLIKIDTQGYELEILKGATEVLKKAEVVLLEISLLDIHQNVPLFADVIEFMKQRNLVAYDICSFTRRPLDNALWQTDILFVKENSFLRQNKKWAQ